MPYGIGKVLDIIYTTEAEDERQRKLNEFCILLLGIFIVGAIGNLGRFYLMQSSGKNFSQLSLLIPKTHQIYDLCNVSSYILHEIQYKTLFLSSK